MTIFKNFCEKKTFNQTIKFCVLGKKPPKFNFYLFSVFSKIAAFLSFVLKLTVTAGEKSQFELIFKNPS